MKKTKGGFALLYRQYIDEMIAEETAKEKQQMATFTFDNVKIRATHLDTGMNCEFDLSGDVTIDTVKAGLGFLKEQGFVKTTMSSNAANKTDNNGKIGKVTAIEKAGDKKQWKNTVTLEEVGAGQQVVMTFEQGILRLNDRVRLGRNEKGYYEAVVVDENAQSQNPIPF